MRILATCLFAAVLAFALPATAHARSATMVPPQTLTLTDLQGRPATPEAIRAAILAGAASTGWTPRAEAPGRIELGTLVRGKHVVVVAAIYSAGSVRFDYVSSENMNHKVRGDGEVRIHPNYMVWRDRLEQAVNAALIRG